jgi:thiol-disulfide isomerase/thioredoxin
MMKRISVAVLSAFVIFVSVLSFRNPAALNLDPVAYASGQTAPELIGKSDMWLNTGGKALELYGPNGLLAADPYAPGKKPVVVVDFWEYTCVNCLATLPYVKDWADRYRSSGLIVIGIHTPEFTFAHETANVSAAVKRLGIDYPVVVDSSYSNWNAYNNEFWPMKYVLDSRGRVVFTHSGEGGYAETERKLRALLLAANPGEDLPPAYGDHEAMPSDAAMIDGMTGELYAGSDRGQLQNEEGYGNGAAIAYRGINPAGWSDGEVVVKGLWRFTGEYAEHARTDTGSDYIGVRYHAGQAVAVIKPQSDAGFKVYVLQDGAPVARGDAGSDLRYDPDGRSYIMVDSPREYQITHNHEFGAHVLALFPSSDRFRLYSFDFEAT